MTNSADKLSDDVVAGYYNALHYILVYRCYIHIVFFIYLFTKERYGQVIMIKIDSTKASRQVNEGKS